MLHPMLLGFFDEDAVKSGKVVLLRPLDLDLANALAEQFSPDRDAGVLSIQGDRFSFEEGYIRCWDIIRSRDAARFVVQLAGATGCMIIMVDAAQTNTPDEFMARFEAMSQYRERLGRIRNTRELE